MKLFYVGEGHRENGMWNGEAKTTAFQEKFPGTIVHQLFYVDDKLVWMDVDLPTNHRFSRFTGRTFPSGDLISGKAVLKNGDTYEGFFFGPNFLGPGRLTQKNGKIKEGIWQLDTLLVVAPLEFSPIVLNPVLPPNVAPASGYYPVINGIEQRNPEFYGKMENNEASGWGMMKMRYYQLDHHSVLAYGKWTNNQFNGPGIYIDQTNGTLQYTSGIFENGQLVHGLKWHTTLSTSWLYTFEETDLKRRISEEIPKMGTGYPNKIWMYAGQFVNGGLTGCGITNEENHFGEFFDRKMRLTFPVEANYVAGEIRGFYFYGDTARKRSYEYLRYTDKITEEKIKMAEAETNFCFDIMSKYQALYVAEMKNRLKASIAAELWEKSPEGLAHKQRVAQANKEYAEKKQKECDEKLAKVGVRGRTYMFRGDPVILSGYDCEKNEFIVWRPWQRKDGYDAPAIISIRAYAPFNKLENSEKQYHTCEDCDGTRKMIVVTSKTRVKELPWGYFSGIETKSIRTTTTEEVKPCDKCGGLAIILR